jgi:hypothetical protein
MRRVALYQTAPLALIAISQRHSAPLLIPAYLILYALDVAL